MKEKRAFVLEDQNAISGAYKETLSYYDLVVKTSIIEAFQQIESDCKLDLFVIAAYVATRASEERAGGELQSTEKLVKRISFFTEGKVPIIVTSDSKTFRDEVETASYIKVCGKLEIAEVLKEISGEKTANMPKQ